MGLLDGKVIAITGAGGGLGRAYATGVAEHGGRVICTDVDGAAAADTAAAIGEAAVALAADAGEWATGERIVATAIEAFGQLDGVVNNAGIVRDKMMWNLTEADLDDVYRVHLKGHFSAAIALARHLRGRGAGGSIVNVTSMAHQGHRGQSNYSAVKGGVASATYTWAMELARFGIRVNAVSPVAWTGMTASMTKDEATATALKARLGPPAQVAPVVVFLLSDEARWISGQILGVGRDRIALLLHPRESRHAYSAGGWTVDALIDRFRQSTGAQLEPLGSETVYPWYDGIVPTEQRGSG